MGPVEEAKEAKEKEAQVVNEEAVGGIWEVTVEAMGAVLVEGKDAAGSAEDRYKIRRGAMLDCGDLLFKGSKKAPPAPDLNHKPRPTPP